jgi:hypothetical protein
LNASLIEQLSSDVSVADNNGLHVRKYRNIGTDPSCAAAGSVSGTSIKRTRIMEAERINLIGTQLASLTARTLDLRGYL